MPSLREQRCAWNLAKFWWTVISTTKITAPPPADFPLCVMAKRILAKTAPSLVGILASGDLELGAASLDQLAFMPHLGLNPELVQGLITALKALKWE